MAETQEGSLARHAVAAACLTVLFVARAAGQVQPQPQIVPAPASPEFLSRYDFHMSVDSLMPPKDTPEEIADERFSWITHFGGSFDVVDLVFARAGARIDYEAVEGSEYRPFDPNQGNYTLEGFVLARAGRFEVGPIFHHVSRHLSDRPKREAIAWNEFGGRLLDRREFGKTSLDVDLDGGYAVQHSFVDYTWIGDARLLVKHPINGKVGIFGTASGQLVGVNDSLGRSTQTGGRVEVGVRVYGRGAVMELYAGYENRVDAYPLDRVPQHWALTGLRLVSR
jgi:hypothetical protein